MRIVSNPKCPIYRPIFGWKKWFTWMFKPRYMIYVVNNTTIICNPKVYDEIKRQLCGQ